MHIDFFNIEYWFCAFASLFGSHCADTGSAEAGESFWGWLFFDNPVFIFIAKLLGILWSLYSVLAYTASFFLFIVIVGSIAGLFLLRAREQAKYANLPPAEAREHPLSERWHALLEDTMSSDPLKWKEGIRGADLMLGELFAKLGYEGETTAERIRHIPEGAFANLHAAWEAHRIKNFALSPSSHFILTQREAFRTMKLYEQVFREFDFI